MLTDADNLACDSIDSLILPGAMWHFVEIVPRHELFCEKGGI